MTLINRKAEWETWCRASGSTEWKRKASGGWALCQQVKAATEHGMNAPYVEAKVVRPGEHPMTDLEREIAQVITAALTDWTIKHAGLPDRDTICEIAAKAVAERLAIRAWLDRQGIIRDEELGEPLYRWLGPKRES